VAPIPEDNYIQDNRKYGDDLSMEVGSSMMKMHTCRHWQPRRNPEQLQPAQHSDTITPLQAQLLALRGITQEDAHAFIHARLKDIPDPALLPDMHKAVTRIVRAIDTGEPIAIHGDYDVDGISATSLLYHALECAGARVSYYIPSRLDEGYGLSGQALCADADAGVKVVISVDCGISSHAEAKIAQDNGIDLIVTDHHQPGDTLPCVFACINPWLDTSGYPYTPLCGAGVAFMLVVALYRALRQEHKAPEGLDIRMLLDLVTLGTVADLVPLTGVNRIMVRAGLPLLEGEYRPGICKLREVAGVEKVNAGVVGFRLAPRLNAAGRLAHAGRGVELLLSKDMRIAQNIATELDQCNRERQEIEEQTLQHARMRIEAELQDSMYTIVLADPGWHSGVIGIVASRLVEMFHRPVILIALDEESGVGKGSGRSIHGCHLYQALKHCSKWMLGYGGHEFAAGLSIEVDKIESFAAALEEYARENLALEDLLPRLAYDEELTLEEIDAQLHAELQALEPYGMGNPEPVFLCRNLKVQQAQVVGGRHLRFRVQQGGHSLPCIAFGLASKLDMLQGRVDILFQVGTNTWQGRTSLQLKVKDVRPAGSRTGLHGDNPVEPVGYGAELIGEQQNPDHDHQNTGNDLHQADVGFKTVEEFEKSMKQQSGEHKRDTQAG
jgi:single-stranded-DNA-specific exonuclease